MSADDVPTYDLVSLPVIVREDQFHITRMAVKEGPALIAVRVHTNRGDWPGKRVLIISENLLDKFIEALKNPQSKQGIPMARMTLEREKKSDDQTE